QWRVGRHPVCAWTHLTSVDVVKSRRLHKPGAHAEEHTRERWTSRWLCTRVHRRPACTPSACQRQEGMVEISLITAVLGYLSSPASLGMMRPPTCHLMTRQQPTVPVCTTHLSHNVRRPLRRDHAQPV